MKGGMPRRPVLGDGVLTCEVLQVVNAMRPPNLTAVIDEWGTGVQAC